MLAAIVFLELLLPLPLGLWLGRHRGGRLRWDFRDGPLSTR